MIDNMQIGMQGNTTFSCQNSISLWLKAVLALNINARSYLLSVFLFLDFQLCSGICHTAADAVSDVPGEQRRVWRENENSRPCCSTEPSAIFWKILQSAGTVTGSSCSTVSNSIQIKKTSKAFNDRFHRQHLSLVSD